MKSAAISVELRDALKRLRLGPVLDTLVERIGLAEKQEMPLQVLALRPLDAFEMVFTPAR